MSKSLIGIVIGSVVGIAAAAFGVNKIASNKKSNAETDATEQEDKGNEE